VEEISKLLVKRGFEIEVLTTDPKNALSKEEVIYNIKVKRFKSWAPNEAFYFSKEIKKYLVKNSSCYDIVIAHSYNALPALYAAKAKRENKFIFFPHSSGRGSTNFRKLLHMFYKPFGKRIFEKADKIICVSNYEKSSLMQRFNLKEEAIEVIPNGVSIENIKDLKDHKISNFRTILYVGRLEKYKGIHYIIKSLLKLNNDTHLEIIGEGPYKKNLVELVNKLDLVERVNFYQRLSRGDLLQRYANADLFILLSKEESFGISVAEALAFKIPCIVANTSALTQWVDNKNCFGIDYPINLDKLTKLITKLIGKKINGQVYLLSWENVVARLARLCVDILTTS